MCPHNQPRAAAKNGPVESRERSTELLLPHPAAGQHGRNRMQGDSGGCTYRQRLHPRAAPLGTQPYDSGHSDVLTGARAA